MTDHQEESTNALASRQPSELARPARLVSRGLNDLRQAEAPLLKGPGQYNLGKSYLRAGRVSEAFRAFETALATQTDSELCAYSLGLVAALLGDDLTVLDQIEALAAKGLTPLSDELFQFLNKHADHIAELGEDEEFNALMCQLVDSKIHAAELLVNMAHEFDSIASGSDTEKNQDVPTGGI